MSKDNSAAAGQPLHTEPTAGTNLLATAAAVMTASATTATTTMEDEEETGAFEGDQNDGEEEAEEAEEAAAEDDEPDVLVTVLPVADERGLYPDADLESGEGIMFDVEPRIWGRPFWDFIHLIAYAYPEVPTFDTKQAAFQTYDALRFILPCGGCREHFREIWKQYPIEQYLDSRDALILWTELIHDEVNRDLKMPSFDLKAYLNRLTGIDAVVDVDEVAEEEEEEEDSGLPAEAQQQQKQQPLVSAAIKSVDLDGSRIIPLSERVVDLDQSRIIPLIARRVDDNNGATNKQDQHEKTQAVSSVAAATATATTIAAKRQTYLQQKQQQQRRHQQRDKQRQQLDQQHKQQQKPQQKNSNNRDKPSLLPTTARSADIEKNRPASAAINLTKLASRQLASSAATPVPSTAKKGGGGAAPAGAGNNNQKAARNNNSNSGGGGSASAHRKESQGNQSQRSGRAFSLGAVSASNVGAAVVGTRIGSGRLESVDSSTSGGGGGGGGKVLRNTQEIESFRQQQTPSHTATESRRGTHNAYVLNMTAPRVVAPSTFTSQNAVRPRLVNINRHTRNGPAFQVRKPECKECNSKRELSKSTF